MKTKADVDSLTKGSELKGLGAAFATASHQSQWAVRYTLAVAAFVVALAARFVLPVQSGLPYLTFYPSIAITALVCGLGPSLLYIVLAALAGAYVFIPPYWTLSADVVVPAIAFILAALTILFVIRFYQHQVDLQTRAQTYLACHDDLTKLANRMVFQDRLRHAIALARREEHLLAVLFIDLDNFKAINDNLGHDVGDLLLKDVAQRLLKCIRDADSVARLGGDEFSALLYNIDIREVDKICKRIADTLGQVFHVKEKDLFITASIGISLFPSDGDDDCTLLKHADAAMYRAKALGKNKFQFFADDIRQEVQRRHALETGLRLARQKNLFSLHYQPKVRIADDVLVGAEALIRWNDPELGIVSPAEFIPVAEKAGLIGDIGLFVVSRAIEDIIDWSASGLAPPPIAVNISPLQLRDGNFAAWLCDSLARAGLPYSSIIVELTEGALMDQGKSGLQALTSLASRGIKISVDDFGTGYSSLSYLKRMPISELKIDRSFIDGIVTEPGDQAITTAILSLAHTLGLTAVAEGVETEQQFAVLRMLGCEIAQGYFFHRPMDRDRFHQLLGAMNRQKFSVKQEF